MIHIKKPTLRFE